MQSASSDAHQFIVQSWISATIQMLWFQSVICVLEVLSNLTSSPEPRRYTNGVAVRSVSKANDQTDMIVTYLFSYDDTCCHTRRCEVDVECDVSGQLFWKSYSEGERGVVCGHVVLFGFDIFPFINAEFVDLMIAECNSNSSLSKSLIHVRFKMDAWLLQLFIVTNCYTLNEVVRINTGLTLRRCWSAS